MTESVLGFILLCFACAIVFLGDTGLHIACWGLAAVIAIVVALIILDQHTQRKITCDAQPRGQEVIVP